MTKFGLKMEFLVRNVRNYIQKSKNCNFWSQKRFSINFFQFLSKIFDFFLIFWHKFIIFQKFTCFSSAHLFFFENPVFKWLQNEFVPPVNTCFLTDYVWPGTKNVWSRGVRNGIRNSEKFRKSAHFRNGIPIGIFREKNSERNSDRNIPKKKFRNGIPIGTFRKKIRNGRESTVLKAHAHFSWRVSNKFFSAVFRRFFFLKFSSFRSVFF